MKLHWPLTPISDKEIQETYGDERNYKLNYNDSLNNYNIIIYLIIIVITVIISINYGF